MLEREFQSKFIKKVEQRFPGCVVLKNDPTYIQGIPDLLILWNEKWAAVECKMNRNASKRPNQSYYIEKLNAMSYAAIVFPENEEEVLNDIQRAFELRG